jgi:hypothetical protein
VNIVPYREWCDVTPRGTPARIATPAPRLWLHHGASGTSTVATARAYARWHIVNNGWMHVGYSFLVAAGKVLEGRGAGRAGAHTSGDNHGSHGVCLVGDYTSRGPSPEDVDALRWLLRHGHAQGWWPTAEFTGGHRDAPGASTSCPGARLWTLIPTLNRPPVVTRPPVTADWFDMATRQELEDVVRQVVRTETGPALLAAVPEGVGGRNVGWLYRNWQRLWSQLVEGKVEVNVDVDTLAVQLREGLGAEVAAELGKRLVR